MTFQAPDGEGLKPGTDSPCDLCEVLIVLRRRAKIKRARAARIAVYKLAGQDHERIRMALRLSVEQFRRARRFLDGAVVRSIASPEKETLPEALDYYEEQIVELATRVGLRRRQGQPRRVIQEALGLSDYDYEQADEWFRDAIAETEEDGD